MSGALWVAALIVLAGAGLAVYVSLHWDRLEPYLPVVTTRWRVAEERAEMARLAHLTEASRVSAVQAHRAAREAQRLLVLLSEPLKDWDLADFPALPFDGVNQRPVTLSHEHAQHLRSVIQAYNLTKGAVAPLRAGTVLNDQARERGWGDAELGRVSEVFRRVGRAVAINPDRKLP